MYCDHAILFVGWSVGGWLVRSFVRYACLSVIQIAIAQPQFEFSEPNLVWGQTMKKKTISHRPMSVAWEFIPFETL